MKQWTRDPEVDGLESSLTSRGLEFWQAGDSSLLLVVVSV